MSTQNLTLHPVHEETGLDQFDVFIAGSGPIGATFARFLVDRGLNVVMVEIGDQETRVPAAHKKNDIVYQKNLDKFTNIVQAGLDFVSVPSASTVIPTLGPYAWRPANPNQAVVLNGRNPYQQAYNNIPSAAITRCVGGMSTHWTCCTPLLIKGLDRPIIFGDDEKTDDAEWDLLYSSAQRIIGTSDQEFNHSVRHNIVLRTLEKEFPHRNPKPLPLACHRLADDSPYVQWHGADVVYGDMFTNPNKLNAEGVQRGRFRLLTNTRCTKLIQGPASSDGTIDIRFAEVQDILTARLYDENNPPQANFIINAKTFVVAAGASAGPQILANSRFGGLRDQPETEMLIPNLGKYLNEHPMAFCQVIMNENVIDWAGRLNDKPKWWRDKVLAHRKKYPDDPLPIPFHDPEPQTFLPASADYPWHTMIHHDAFSYGAIGPSVEARTVVDLRFFGRQDGVAQNRMIFERTVTDAFDMPQITFEYELTQKYAKLSNRMMADMTEVASRLGSYLPGSEPQFLLPGITMHLGGGMRAGNDPKDSVCDFNSKVWNFGNLFVGGNAVVPTAYTGNPTITSICFAIRAAHKLYNDLKAPTGTTTDEIVPTPKDWVNWLFDKNDPNYPQHEKLRAPHRSVAVNE